LVKSRLFGTLISPASNFSVLETLGSARVAIELRTGTGGGSELLAIHRHDETDGETERVEIRAAARARQSWA
jgi:hypothetical protein